MLKYTRILFFKVFIFLFPVFLFAQPRIWNINTLQNAKLLTSEVAKKIIRDANKNLTKSISTVMDKPMVAPSGDKHDYMSMGRYWWPDPSKKDGLPYIRNDGHVNHEIDKLDRMPLSEMARSVETLSIAYYLTLDDKYARKAVENLRIWFLDAKTKMNPNMNYGQTIPGRKNGEGRGEGVLDTYSFVEMLDGVELLKSSKKFTEKDQTELKQWFSSYLDWLMTSDVAGEERDAKNNHGTAYDVQVVRYALYVGKEDVAQAIIIEFPTKRLYTQIEPNGAQPLELARTTAFGYSVFNLTHFLDMATIAKTLKINLLEVNSSDGRSILKAVNFLVPFVGKDVSEFPFKQIKSWESVQKSLCWQLYRVDKLLGKSDYKKYYRNQISESDKDNETLIY